jgi:hypothetical protein
VKFDQLTPCRLSDQYLFHSLNVVVRQMLLRQMSINWIYVVWINVGRINVARTNVCWTNICRTKLFFLLSNLKNRLRVKCDDFFSSGAQVKVRIVVDDLIGQSLTVGVAQDGDAGHLVQSLGMDLLRLRRDGFQ